MSNVLACACGHRWDAGTIPPPGSEPPRCPKCGAAVAEPTEGATSGSQAMAATVLVASGPQDATPTTSLPRLLTCPCGYQGKISAVPAAGAGASLVCPQCGKPVEPFAAAPDGLVPTDLPTRTMPRPRGDWKPPRSLLPDVPGYEVLGELGRGGMGVVYKARQKSLNRVVALKMLLGGARFSERSLARFRAEAEAVARLQHPNIVQVYEVSEFEGQPFFSLEFVDGGSLAHKLAGEPQPVRPTVELVEVLARAMDCAHRAGIIHRDLKPGNVLLQAPGAEPGSFGTPKVTDFGLAKRLDDDSGMTKSGEVMGTPSYMAPEQAMGRLHDIGPATDVYALGAILYEALVGRPPFRADTAVDTMLLVSFEDPVPPSRMRTRLPADVETICLTCLRKEPQKRYASAGALADDLRRFLSGEPIQARPASLAERAAKWARRRPAAAALLVVSTVAVIALLAVSLAYNVRLNEANADLAEARDSEHRKAEEARQQKEVAEEREREADRLRQLAEEQKAVAQRERTRAEANFRAARNAVDLMLTRVAQEHLRHVPGMAREREKLLEEALKFYESLPQQDAGTEAVRQETGRAFRRVGTISRHLGKQERARQAFEKSIEHFRNISRDFPQQPVYWNDLALSHFRFGELLRDTGALPEARKQYEAALADYERVLKDDGRHAEALQGLGRTWNDLALVLRHQNQFADARAAYDRALAIQKDVVARFGEQPEYVQDLAGSYNDRGILFQQAGELERAEADYRAALPYFRSLEAKYPDNIEYRWKLAAAYGNLGTVLRALAVTRGDADARQRGLKDAEDALKEALAQREKLVVAFPTVPNFQRELAAGCGNLATVRVDLNRLAEAEKDFQRARSVFRALAAEFPAVPEYQSGLAGTLDNLAVVLRRQGHPDRALTALNEALRHHDAALKGNEQQPDYRQLLRLHYRVLAETLLQTGKATEAGQAADESSKRFPKDATETYQAAVLLARLSALAAKERSLAAGERKTVAEDFAARAVRRLGQALRDGYRPAISPANDPAFAPLRIRKDFRELTGLDRERT